MMFVPCAGAEGFTTEEDQEMLNNIERQMKRRFVIGSQVSEHAIIQDFLRQVRTKLTCTYYSLDVKQLTLSAL